MKITVCVGSSCHIKGSHDILMRIQELIKEHKLEKKVELCASFCLGQCARGVSMKVDDELILDASKDNIDAIFEEKVLKALGE